jgi:ATP-dependent DNA helicase RecG
MNRTELSELILNGESSGVDFKRDDLTPEKLAKAMAALLNLEGGHVLLGVEDDGSVSGLVRPAKKAEEWVMEAARTHLRPAANPYWETVEWESGRIVGIVTLTHDAPNKPYKAKRGSSWVTMIRVGTTSRDATDEEESRLYMQGGRIQYDRKPVPGASFQDLDLRRLTNYFRDVRRQESPDASEREPWIRLLVNTKFLVEDRERAVPSAGGLLLFGTNPGFYLPHVGISAVAYRGVEKDYDAQARELLMGPAVSLFSAPSEMTEPSYPRLSSSFADDTTVVESGLIEQALGFVKRNIASKSWIDDGGRRQESWEYPLEAVREAIVNAIAHRDYTITVTDIEVSLYADRLEVISPGRLPNTMSVEKMRAGYRASRNELVKEVLRDYRYVEATGLGVPRKIIAGMRKHNGTEPDLIEEEDRFLVRLWKRAKPGAKGQG